MNPEAPKRWIKSRVLRIFSWITGISLGTLLFVLGTAILAIAIFVRTDTFQNALRDRIIQVAKTELNALITFESAEVSIFNLEPSIHFLNVKFEHAPTKTVAEMRRISIGMSIFVSVPLLFFKELNLSSIELEGLSYQLNSIKVVQQWLDLMRPKYGFIPSSFQTSVGRIGFRDVEVQLNLPEAAFYSRGISGQVKLDSVDLYLKAKETQFKGSFTFSNLASKGIAPLSGTLSVESGSFNSSRLDFKNLQLRNGEDVFDISGGLKRWDNPILDIHGRIDAKLDHLFSRWALGGILNTDFSVRGPWNKLEGDGEAKLRDLEFRTKKWERAEAKWSLKYPQIELKSVSWVSGEERGELKGTIPLEPDQKASFDIKLDPIELGPHLGLFVPTLVKWRGKTTGTIHYEGTLYPEVRGDFDWKLHISNYQIRSPGDVYSFGLPELDVSGKGVLHSHSNGNFTASLTSGDSKWNGDASWNSKDFALRWDAVFKGGEFGELLQKKVKLNGTMKGSYSGPVEKLVMSVEPKFSEFSLNGQQLTNVRGKLMLANRVLYGDPMESDQVKATGGILFQEGRKPDEYSNLRIETNNLDIQFLFDTLNIRDDFTGKIKSRVFMDGSLRGPVMQPIGSGAVRLEDWAINDDFTKGRMAKAKWASAGGELYLDRAEVRFSRGAEPLVGELSFDGRGLADLALEGTHLRVSDLLYLFNSDLSLQGFADLGIDYQRSSPSLKANIKIAETVVGGVHQKDSDFKMAWIADRMEFSGRIFGDAIDLSGVSFQNLDKRETDVKFSISKFNGASLFRDLANSRLEIPIEGAGNITYIQPRMKQDQLIPALFVTPGQYKGEVKVQRASVLKGNSTLQSIDPFTIRLSGTGQKTPRYDFGLVKIRSIDHLLELRGFFESKQKLSLDLKGELDLRAITGMYPQFSRSEGLASVEGVFNEKGFTGKLFITNGLMTFQSSPLVVRNVSAELRGTGSTFELKQLRGDLREGSLVANGRLDLNGPEIRSATVSVQLQNTLIQPLQGVSFRASGPLNLKIQGKEGEVDGRLSIRDGLYRRRLDVKADLLKLISSDRSSFKTGEEEEAAWKSWKVNILLATEDPFDIRNNLAEGSANINLNVLGTIGAPRLKGSISIVRGEFYYHNRQFTLSSGSIQFSDQSSNIPSFDIRAATEIGEYRISVQILGDANDQKIKYSSDPMLSEKDILSLVSFGYRSSDTDIKEQDPTRSASLTGISFVTGQLQDKIEGGLSSGLGIRRFQLVPSYYDRTGKTELQMTVGTDLVRNRLEVNYSSFLSAVGGQKVELEYKFNHSLSLIGSWRNMEGQDQDDFGGDLRFRFEFE